ncbi:ketopantoate reductase family protein [Alishewanella jeotgali]|uniref:2-dehydropantoate 2-reductase n=1 Tax=Alishewanella jeotgali KCTC 22429 TaxID=1129374 RepID=H3ZHR8_9ALTE|nr:2-dehydropantoate 2-reductase [Alishewanella jeotgali]EHR39924.1 2-dehydropantoate 2-reductase [Alishewanella jeotgali KCTC 22429]
MATTQPQCSIVGQGAIGLLAASNLQLAGWQVSLWLRQSVPLAIDYQAIDGALHSLRFQASRLPAQLLLVPVKAYALFSCLDELLPALNPGTQLVISHNGMPDLAALTQLVGPKQALWFLSTSQAALRTPAGVSHTGVGSSILAPLNPEAQAYTKEVTSWLNIALGPLTLTSDIRPALWRKLAVNAAINPLTALLQCKNGVLADAEFQPQLQAIVAEVCVVAAAEGIALSLDATLALVYQVIAATAANQSSMLQDVKAGRRTELSAITGFIVQTAARHGLAVPANQKLWQALAATA